MGFEIFILKQPSMMYDIALILKTYFGQNVGLFCA